MSLELLLPLELLLLLLEGLSRRLVSSSRGGACWRSLLLTAHSLRLHVPPDLLQRQVKRMHTSIASRSGYRRLAS